jgi:WD40 repeat protein
MSMMKLLIGIVGLAVVGTSCATPGPTPSESKAASSDDAGMRQFITPGPSGMALALEAESSRLATASATGDVVVLDLAQGEVIASERVLTAGTVLALTFSKHAGLIAGTDRGTLLWLDPRTLERIHELAVSDEAGRRTSVHLALSPNGETIAAVVSHRRDDLADELLLIDVTRRETSGRIELEPGVEPASVAWSPDGTRVYVGTWHRGPSSVIYVCDTVTRRVIRQWNTNNLVVIGLAAINADLVASVSVDATVKLWSASTGRQIAKARHTGRGNSLSVSPDGRWLAVSGWDGRLTLWTAVGLHSVADIDVPTGRSQIAFTPDGTSLIHAADNVTVIPVQDLIKDARLKQQ